jgi:hypothetical protein
VIAKISFTISFLLTFFVSPFEREGLSDLRDKDLEAIPADMLSATDGIGLTLPDLQHLADHEIRRLAKDLCEEYPDFISEGCQ